VEALADIAAGRQVVTGRFYGLGSGAWPGSRWNLSPRESETLALLAIGMSNRTIGEALFISENTVRTHLKSVYRKLGVTSRSQAVAKALSDASFSTGRRQILDGEGPLKQQP
jgi:two-component system, NarL family, response regulator LiaR